MGTGENLTASERVQRLQTALHAKAKEAPDFRFHSLCDKVWRADVLAVAWQAVRRNGGAAGVDGETVADVESLGVNQWLGALAHATRRLRQWLCRKHKVRAGKYVRFSQERLRKEYGLIHLGTRTASFPWAKA